MQRLISRRTVESTSRPRLLSVTTDPVTPTKSTELQKAEDITKSMNELALRVDSDLVRAAHSVDQVHGEIERLASTLVDVSHFHIPSSND